MKVLIINSTANPKSGYCLDYSSIVDKLIYVIARRNYPDEFIIKDNVFIEYIGYRFILTKYIKLYKVSSKYIKQGLVDLISANEPFSGLFVGFLLKKRFNIPFNVQIYATVLENNYNENLKLRLFSQIIKFFLKLSDSIRAMCESHKKMLISTLGIEGERIYACPPNYDLEIFAKLPNESIKNQFKKYANIVLFVGRLTKQKDVPTLLQSISLVKKKIPRVLCLIIGDGPEKNKLIRLSRKLMISENVKFLGKIIPEEVSKYFVICDVFILPSVRESLGVVLIEAAACKKPVISTNTVGARELVVNGFNGFIVNIKDYKALATRICYLLENPKLLNEFGLNHFERLSKLGYLDSSTNLLKVQNMWRETIFRKKGERL